MVTDDAYAAVVAENQRLRQRMAKLTGQLEAALQRSAALETRVAGLEAKKTPPPSFVKANVPVRPPKPRRKRAPEHNHGRRREAPTQIVAHPLIPNAGVYCGQAQAPEDRRALVGG